MATKKKKGRPKSTGEKKATPKARGKQLTLKERLELHDMIRRLHVLGGVSLREIERETGYAHKTVLKAWSDIKEELAEDFANEFGGSETVIRALKRKEQRVNQLTRIALKADNVSDRIRAVSTANSIDDGIIGLLQDLGVVERRLGEITQTLNTTKVFDIEGLEYER